MSHPSCPKGDFTVKAWTFYSISYGWRQMIQITLYFFSTSFPFIEVFQTINIKKFAVLNNNTKISFVRNRWCTRLPIFSSYGCKHTCGRVIMRLSWTSISEYATDEVTIRLTPKSFSYAVPNSHVRKRNFNPSITSTHIGFLFLHPKIWGVGSLLPFLDVLANFSTFSLIGTTANDYTVTSPKRS